ncbi:NAD(+) diphosphatase [Kytococcus sedentarius]|uniref:NAD(+) diphosphatase n=1 Tax=Kytococcus sedentarius TaxID=1276 RepID=UPI00384E786C
MPALDRAAWLRGAAGAAPRWDRQGPQRRLWVTVGGELAVQDDPVAVLWREGPGGGVPDLDADGVAHGVEVFLGQQDAAALVAVVVEDVDAVSLPPGARWADLKQVGEELAPADLTAALTAVGMARWHQTHRFSPRTGRPTQVAASGWVRREEDGREHYPRTDAAVIMSVVDDRDRLLLARGRSWPAGRLSVLAGFVEPGESLEEAVAREVLEEVSVSVDDVRYVASQPWPFPASLMVGFAARAGRQPDAVEPSRLEHDEIAEARWVTREELAAEVAAGRLGVPGRFSLARRLIEEWFGGPLPVVREIRGSVRD